MENPDIDEEEDQPMALLEHGNRSHDDDILVKMYF